MCLVLKRKMGDISNLTKQNMAAKMLQQQYNDKHTFNIFTIMSHQNQLLTKVSENLNNFICVT